MTEILVMYDTLAAHCNPYATGYAPAVYRVQVPTLQWVSSKGACHCRVVLRFKRGGYVSSGGWYSRVDVRFEGESLLEGSQQGSFQIPRGGCSIQGVITAG